MAEIKTHQVYPLDVKPDITTWTDSLTEPFKKIDDQQEKKN